MQVSDDLMQVLMVMAAIGTRYRSDLSDNTIKYTTPHNVDFTVNATPHNVDFTVNATPHNVNFTPNYNIWGLVTATYGKHVVTFEHVVWSTGNVVTIIGNNVTYVVNKDSWGIYRVPATADESPSFSSGKFTVIEGEIDDFKATTFIVDDATVLQASSVWNGNGFDIHIEFFV